MWSAGGNDPSMCRAHLLAPIRGHALTSSDESTNTWSDVGCPDVPSYGVTIDVPTHGGQRAPMTRSALPINGRASSNTGRGQQYVVTCTKRKSVAFPGSAAAASEMSLKRSNSVLKITSLPEGLCLIPPRTGCGQQIVENATRTGYEH